MSKTWIATGAVFAFLSVALGAFGAHGLDGKLDARMLAVWETAARYQMYHALGLIGFGLWLMQPTISGASEFTAWAFSVGIVLFSGSLYILALSGIKTFGMITPLGGLAFMAGWIAFAIAALRAS